MTLVEESSSRKVEKTRGEKSWRRGWEATKGRGDLKFQIVPRSGSKTQIVLHLPFALCHLPFEIVPRISLTLDF